MSWESIVAEQRAANRRRFETIAAYHGKQAMDALAKRQTRRAAAQARRAWSAALTVVVLEEVFEVGL